MTCAYHADLVQDTNGEWWGVFLACRPAYDNVENLGRETFMLPVRWTSDGWPYLTTDGQQVPMVVQKHNAERGDNPTFGNFSYVDDFSAPELALDWLTLRAPATDLYSLTETPGKLSLKCAPVSVGDKDVPAFLSKRVQHHKFEASADMEFSTKDAKEHAGMVLFKDEIHHYKFVKDQSSLAVVKVSENGEETIASTKFSAPKVSLKISSDGKGFSFLYSANGGKSWRKLASGVDASHTSTHKAGGFTGSTIGLYASSK